MKEALESAKIEATELEDVILIGGSTRIPVVQRMVKEYLKLKIEIINKSYNPEEQVARGAAVLGGMIARGEDLKFQDVTSLAYGVESHENGVDVLDMVVPRNSPYSISKSAIYRTFKKNQDRVRIKVLQGKTNG